MKANLTEQLAEAKTQLNHVPEHLSHIYTNTAACSAVIDEMRNQILFRFQIHAQATPDNIQNGLGYLISESRSDLSQQFVTLKSIHEELVSSDPYKEAEKLIKPILAAITKLETAIAVQRTAELQAAQERLDAKQSAIEKAISEVEASFATA